MASRRQQQQQQPVIFTLPSNASMDLYPDNTTTDYRVELPSRVELGGNDYEVALASFTYHRSWYNVLTSQPYTAVFTFEAGHEHRGAEEGSGDFPCDSGLFTEGRSYLRPGYYETLDAVLEALYASHGGSRPGFIFTRQGPSGRVLLQFRPGLKHCVGRVTITPALSWLLGWPYRETVLVGRVGTGIRAPAQPRLEPVDCLYVHCDLAQDAHVVGNVKNCLLRTVPTRGRFGEVVCYEPRLLDWLPVRWTEFKNLHVVITDGFGQKIPFEGGTCSVKLLLRRRRGLI